MINNSILIISNDENVGNQISQKIKLLRECDTIKIVSYLETISVLNTTQPSLMLVYCSNSDSVNIIKEIRSIKALDKVPIILVMDTMAEEKLLYAFDNRIDDFFFLTDTDSIILMRILLTLQKAVLNKQIEIFNEIMVAANIVEKQTGIYLKEQAPIALRNFFSKSMEENMENTVFMYLKPVNTGNKKLNTLKIAQTVKSVPRGNDIVAYGKNLGFYLILYNAGIKGAKSVAQRIKKLLVDTCEIYAVAAEITAPFEQMEPVLCQILKDQIETGKDFNYLYDLNFNQALESTIIRDETGKQFKDFKKEFFENFEKIIAPVFYQEKTSIENKFPEAKIEFNINETESSFIISQNGIKSELILTYPAYIKLIIDIKHYENDIPPMIRRLTYDFDDFSSEQLSSIIEDIVTEFTSRINMNSIKAELPE